MKGAQVTIESDINRIRKVKDPLERARLAHSSLIPEATTIRRQTIAIRALAALEANEAGASFADIAQELSVSKALVQQMVEWGRQARESGDYEGAPG